MKRVVVTGMGIVSSIGNNTQEVLASSGIIDDAALDHYQTLINSVSEWTEEIVTTDDAVSETGAELTAVKPPSATSNNSVSSASIETVVTEAPANQTVETGIARSAETNPVEDIEDPVLLLRPTEEELQEVTSYTLGCWLQLPKAGGGFQQLKVAWISGISGLVMFVNRRGARVMALSPPEVIDYRNRGQLVLFEREAPVDQAMSQLLEKLRTKLEAQSTVGSMN